MFNDFKAFVMRGNVLDLAVGVIIGGAFGGIVSSLVSDVIMPPIGLLLGGIDFQNVFIPLNGQQYATLAAAKEANAPVMALGLFLNQVINFVILAFVIFLIVRAATKMKKPVPAAAPTTKDCPFCLSTIPLGATRCPNCTSQL